VEKVFITGAAGFIGSTLADRLLAEGSGPGGTLWGANAVNGVINVITKSSADTAGLHAQAGTGSQTDRLASVRYGGSLSPDISLRAYAKHLDYDSSPLADGSSATDAWHKTQAGFRIDSGTTDGDSQTVQGDIYRLHNLEPGGTSTMRGANLLARWTHRMRSRRSPPRPAPASSCRRPERRPSLRRPSCRPFPRPSPRLSA
jgi:outer membrane receptor protein involved in Fe transport